MQAEAYILIKIPPVFLEAKVMSSKARTITLVLTGFRSRMDAKPDRVHFCQNLKWRPFFFSYKSQWQIDSTVRWHFRRQLHFKITIPQQVLLKVDSLIGGHSGHNVQVIVQNVFVVSFFGTRLAVWPNCHQMRSSSHSCNVRQMVSAHPFMY